MSCWEITSIGNAKGSILMDGKQSILHPGCGKVSANDIYNCDIIFDSDNGKISDSEDSFLFLYTEINPFEENFRLEAEFTIMESEHIPDYQTGYGIAVVDTVASCDRSSRFRNQLEVGRFRTSGGLQHAAGVRVVSGYTDKNALNQYGRVLDSSRRFSKQRGNDDIEPGDISAFAVEKNDEGFILSYGEESIFFPGHDFLCRQDENHIYVGIFAAGRVTVRLSGISFYKTQGSLTNVPENFIKSRVMDYPYERTLIETCMLIDQFLERYCRKNSEGEYILKKGTHRLRQGVYIPRDTKEITIRCEEQRETILDGSEIEEKIPLITMHGSSCVLDGLIIQNSKSCGVHVCGNGNTVQNCEVLKNGDTGILICSFPGEIKERWPINNKIINCVSHDNCDTAFYNADGFGAKLTIGSGNEFVHCTAHHNVDDGFDLFTKAYLGYIAPVSLTDCISYRNGMLSDGSFLRPDSVCGFKLGGENIGVKHVVSGCRAYENKGFGINQNTNPFPEIINCREWSNNYSKGQLPDNRSRKNIMFLLPGLSNGGAERVTVHLANALCPKCNVSIAYYNDDRCDYKADGAVNIIPIRIKEIEKLDAVRRIERIFIKFGQKALFDRLCGNINKKRKIQMLQSKAEDLNIHTVISMLDIPNSMNAKLKVPRRIMSERNDSSKKGEKYFELESESFKEADIVVFQSDYVKGMFDERIQKKSRVIANPVNMPLRNEQYTAGKIVNVGRLHSQKNQKLLIEAFSEFHKTHTEYKLHIYGRGNLENELRTLIKTLNLEKSVLFEGYCDNIYEEIRDAEFFVLSSDYEGMSNSLMEALAMGIPCIATDCAGVRELIADKDNGLIVPVGDKDALAKAMDLLADSKEMQERFSKKSVEYSKKYAIDEIVKQWEEIL